MGTEDPYRKNKITRLLCRIVTTVPEGDEYQITEHSFCRNEPAHRRVPGTRGPSAGFDDSSGLREPHTFGDFRSRQPEGDERGEGIPAVPRDPGYSYRRCGDDAVGTH